MRLWEDAAGAEAVEKEVQVEQAGVAFPGSHELAGFCVVGTRAKAMVLLKIVPAADIVSGEDVEAPHAAQERVFGGPTTDAANGEEFFERSGVVKLMEGFEIQFAGSDGAAEFKDGAFFVVAVAEGAKSAGGDVRKIGGCRAGPPRRAGIRRRIGGGGAAEIFDEAIQEHHADVERHLLARNSVQQSFEDGGIARRFEADECGSERAQSFLFCGEGVEGAEIDGEAKHAFERGAKDGLKRGSAIRAACGDAEARMRGRVDLLDGEFDDVTACVCGDGKCAAISLAVPAIENVFGAAAQCPNGEVEAKGWNRTEREGKRRICGSGLGAGGRRQGWREIC